MFSNLLTSRRFWIAVVAVLVNLATVVTGSAAQYKPVIDAFNTFALALIAAFTVEDSARNFGKPY